MNPVTVETKKTTKTEVSREPVMYGTTYEHHTDKSVGEKIKEAASNAGDFISEKAHDAKEAVKDAFTSDKGKNCESWKEERCGANGSEHRINHDVCSGKNKHKEHYDEFKQDAAGNEVHIKKDVKTSFK